MTFSSNKRIIVAHRGWSGLAPENSMAAFRLAIADPRISWIELDVQLSKDGIPVVIHDYKLRRTTSASGDVKDYTAEQLSQLDNGSWFSLDFHNERIPTLEQVLKEIQGRVKLNIELKTKDQLYPGLEQAVINLVQAYSLEDDVVITSFDTGALLKTKRLAPSIRTGLITSDVPITIKDQLRVLGADLLSVDYRIVDPKFVRSMMESGYDVMVWTVNEPQTIMRLVSLNPTLWICSNYPDRFF
ncbi:MAG: glycerophosphodiester phosphodiesterase family protein [Paenibacillaceae bacterium]